MAWLSLLMVCRCLFCACLIFDCACRSLLRSWEEDIRLGICFSTFRLNWPSDETPGLVTVGRIVSG